MINILEKIFFTFRSGDFEFKNIEVYELKFDDKNSLDYLSKGRDKHLLHLVTSGIRTYSINGKKFQLGADSLIFIPEGTKYKTETFCDGAKNCSGIGISFCCDNLLIQKDIYYEEEIRHIENIKELFHKVHRIYNEFPLEGLLLKAAVYDVFSYIIRHFEKKTGDFLLIKPAIEYINANYRDNSPVKVYSDKCNLSESYFRKVFSRYMGVSPIEYRDTLRFAEAKRLYQIGFSSQEIAEKLGFCDSNYLLKQYKKYTGKSLKSDSKTL